jgi:hypothetical protein
MCAHGRDEHGRPAAPVLVLAVLMALAANACGDSPHERHDARPPGGGQTLGIDPATLTCGGVGVPTTRVHGEPAWIRFRCVQPTFPPGSVAGPDLIFIVEPSRARTPVVSERRLTS